MKQDVAKAYKQYVDGAITYVEFVRKAIEIVTREDCHAHNVSVSCMPEYVATWPFKG